MCGRLLGMSEASFEAVAEVMERLSPWRGRPGGFHLSASLKHRNLTEDLIAETAVFSDPYRRPCHKIVIGPRRTGKTTLLHHIAKHVVENRVVPAERVGFFSFDIPTVKGASLQSVLDHAKTLLGASYEEPGVLLIDEIAYAEEGWDLTLKNSFDYPDIYPFRIVATSSSSIKLGQGVSDSGAGRWSVYRLLPCQMREWARLLSWHTTGLEFPEMAGDTLLEKLASLPEGHSTAPEVRDFLDVFSVYGGMPLPENVAEMDRSEASVAERYQRIRSSLVKVIREDVPTAYKIEALDETDAVFHFLSRNPCGLVDKEKLCQTIGISDPTLSKILNALDTAMLTFRLKNFAGERKQQKVCFTDIGFPAAFTDRTAQEMETSERGWVWENIAASALLNLTETRSGGSGKIWHYRDSRNREVDLIYRQPDLTHIAIEIKSSYKGAPEAFTELSKMNKPPKFMDNYIVCSPDARKSFAEDVKRIPLAEFLIAVEEVSAGS